MDKFTLTANKILNDKVENLRKITNSGRNVKILQKNTCLSDVDIFY